MSKYIGAIDQGTKSTRFVIFDKTGHIVASHREVHKEISIKPGWVEHDPLVLWMRTQSAIKKAMEKGRVKASDLAAIGVTNQRETTLIWNKDTGKPYGNAIVWQDTRTKDICAKLALEGGRDRFLETTGLPLTTYFSGPKIKWMLDNIPGLRRSAEAGKAIFGTVDSWLIWLLNGGARRDAAPNENGEKKSGVHLTDVTNASRTMLMNLKTLNWDDEILRLFNIPRQMLPEIRPSSGNAIFGMTSIAGPFNGVVPICGAMGDQQAALYGQACFERGDTKNTYGTGCFMLQNIGKEITLSKHGLITTVAYKMGEDPAVYALEGSIANAGSLVHWLHDNLTLIPEASKIDGLASSVTDSGGIYFVPAFSGLFAPYWRDDARGIIAGITKSTNKGHFARAVLEATAYQTREVFDAMFEDSGIEITSMKVDGGMVASEILMQFQADILGVPVVRPAVRETSARGVAYAAGLAIGFWGGEAELRANWHKEKEWRSHMTPQNRQIKYDGWLKAVERTLGWVV